MRLKIVIALLIAAIFAGGMYIYSGYKKSGVPDKEPEKKEVEQQRNVSERGPVTEHSPNTNTLVNTPTADDLTAVSTNESALLESLEELVSEERYTESLKLCRELMKSDDPEVRQEVALSLGWIGSRALPELSLMLRDENSDVAELAYEQWAEILNGFSDKLLVIKLLGAALSDVNNEYIVNSGVILFDSVPENLAVPAIVDLIKNGGAVASEIAREHYEFTTGEPYQSKEMTDKWLKENASDDDDQ